MTKQIIGNEKAVEALAAICKDYRGTALRAIRQGEEEVFIPANPNDSRSTLEALSDPEKMFLLTNEGNARGTEPCYVTYDEFLAGQNTDGTNHAGYLAIDIVAKVVTDFCDRKRNSVVPREVKPFNPQKAVKELTGQPESYCL